MSYNPSAVTPPIPLNDLANPGANKLVGDTNGGTTTGAVTVGSGLSLSSGVLSASGGGGGSSQLGVYGTGEDGAVTAGAGSTSLTNDVLATTYHVPSGSTVHTNGFKILATTSITLDAGGSVTGNGQNGAAGASGGGGGGGVTGTITLSPSGGAASSDVTGAAPGNDAIHPVSMNGGNGGAGGAGGSNANAGTGGVSILSHVREAASMPLALSLISNFLGQGLTTGQTFAGGSGGGGGGGDSGNAGGGGGAGGLYVVLCSPTITNNGTISATGGNGGAGNPAGNTGGGGGGAGGVVLTIGTFTGTSPVLTAGTGGVAGGTGTAGSNGAAGHWLEFSA